MNTDVLGVFDRQIGKVGHSDYQAFGLGNLTSGADTALSHHDSRV